MHLRVNGFNVLAQVDNRILEVLLAILCLPQSDRMRVCTLIPIFFLMKTFFNLMVEIDMPFSYISFFITDVDYIY